MDHYIGRRIDIRVTEDFDPQLTSSDTSDEPPEVPPRHHHIHRVKPPHIPPKPSYLPRNHAPRVTRNDIVTDFNQDEFLDLPPQPLPRKHRIARRHTVTGSDEAEKSITQSVLGGDTSQHTRVRCQTRVVDDPISPVHCANKFNSISRREADRKRAAFLQYLQVKYPEHADVISGRSRSASGNSRIRSSISSSDASSCFHPLSPQNDTTTGGFVRGGKFRRSLPTEVKSDRGRHRANRVVYLQLNEETRPAYLPLELTNLDTIRALFVQAYPGVLTMPSLDTQQSGIYLKNTKTGNFEEVNNVKKIKDRSFLRVRGRNGSGIPMPGQKKSPARILNKNENNTSNQTPQKPTNLSGKLKNGFGLKIPSQNSKPALSKQQDKNKIDTNNNKHGKNSKNGPANADTLHGNGVGDGSVSKTGFSYHQPDVGNTSNNNNQIEKSRDMTPPARGLKQSSKIGQPSAAKKGIPAPKSKLSMLKPKAGKTNSKPSSPATNEAEVLENQNSETTKPAPMKPPISAKPKPVIPIKSKSLMSPSTFYSKQPKKLSLLTQPSSAANTYSIKSLSTAALQDEKSVHIEETSKTTDTPERKATINRIGTGRTYRTNKPGLIPVGIPKVPQAQEVNEPEKQPTIPYKTRENSICQTSQTTVVDVHVNGRSPTPVNVPIYAQLSTQETTNIHQNIGNNPLGVDHEHANNNSPPSEPVNVLKFASALEHREKVLCRERVPSPSMHTKPANLPTSNKMNSILQKQSSRETFNSSLPSRVDHDDGLVPPEDVQVLKSSMAKIGSENSVVSSETSGSSVCSSKPNLHKKNDVMVCDVFGDNTYVERLKSKSTDDVAHGEGWDDRSAAEQLGMYTADNNYREFSQNKNLRDSEPTERKSAVAAAIETITGKSSASGRTTPSMAKSPINLPDQIPRNSSSPYKENWYPKQIAEIKTPNYAMLETNETPTTTNSYPLAIMAVSPLPTLSYTPMKRPKNSDAYGTSAIIYQEAAADPSPYFQTQSGFPLQKHEKLSYEGSPYYECNTSEIAKNKPLGRSGEHLDNAKTKQQRADFNYGNTKDDMTYNKNETPSADVKLTEDEMDSTSSGIVETYNNQTDKPKQKTTNDQGKEIVDDSKADRPPPGIRRDPGVKRSEIASSNMPDEVKRQIVSLKNTTKEMRFYLDEIKRQQRKDMETLSELIASRTQELTKLVSVTSGADHRPIRARRIALDNQRQNYQTNAADTERQLADVEAAVEELRNEVVERRCRVNTKEVETLALQLSHAGRAIADLKSSFPKLSDELKSVGSAETEVVIQEEKFIDTEPPRLDDQLKRCKQVTATLFTLKKLANVQEARSKTPVQVQNNVARPETPSQYLTSLSLSLHGSQPPSNDPEQRTKKPFLEEIRKQRINNARRMQSLQEAELTWNRRVKFIKEYDSKKLEKALELAEKALRQTDNAKAIEEKQQKQLETLYKNSNNVSHVKSPNRLRNTKSTTLSASSSLESLPPPPPRMSNIKPPSTRNENNQSESIGSTALSPPSSITYASSTSSIATNPTSENFDPSEQGNYSHHHQRSPHHHTSQKGHPGHRNTTPHMMYPDNDYGNPVYRSNSLQRPRGRGQQMQQYEQYQKQRSRTPNPSMNFDHYGYHMQMQTVQYNNAHYVQHGANYVNYNVNNNSAYMPPSNYNPYNPRATPKHFEGGQMHQQTHVGRSQSQKFTQSHLRKPLQYGDNSPNPYQQQSKEHFHQQDDQKPPQQFTGDKSHHLKEQYNKLQQMQRKQRSESSRLKKKIPPSQRKPPSRSQTPTMINTSAKSSDV